MEKITGVNAARIKWCCTDLGISLEECASATGIPVLKLEALASGEPILTFNQLKKLADFFGRGILFFLEEGPANLEQIHSPQFRTLANQKPEISGKVRALIERAENHRTVYLALQEELEEDVRPPFSPPDLKRTSPREAAAIIRSWLSLKETNDFDSYRSAIEARGCLVFRSNGYNGKWQIAKESPILGFSLYDPTCPIIVIKKQTADAQQVFTMFHELGHLLLHKKSYIDDAQDLQSHAGHEQQANAFAGLVLIPDSFLNDIDDLSRPEDVSLFDEWLNPQRRSWGVSTEVILRRLMDNSRLPQSDYVAYRKWCNDFYAGKTGRGSRAYRHREPKHVFGDAYVRTVLDALNGKRITLNKACKYLDNLKVKDIHLLEQHYAGI